MTEYQIQFMSKRYYNLFLSSSDSSEISSQCCPWYLTLYRRKHSKTHTMTIATSLQLNLKKGPIHPILVHVSDYERKLQCHESLAPVLFFKLKIHEWHSSVLQRNSNFHCSILRLAPTGSSRGLRHKQDPADGDKAQSQRQSNSSSQ